MTVQPSPDVDLSASLTRALDGDEAAFLNGAVAAIRRAAGWHIFPVIRHVIRLDGDGGSLLQLPSLRVEDIHRVTNDGKDLDVTTLEWSEKGMIRSGGCWSRKFRGIEVELTHGFTEEAVPDLVALAVSVAARASASPRGHVSEATGGVSIQFSRLPGGASGGIALFAHEWETLGMYKLPPAV